MECEIAHTSQAVRGGSFRPWARPQPVWQDCRGSKREGAMAGLLDGKAALITGAGGGIGRATALAFAREGARVALADAAAEAARETMELLNAAGSQAIVLLGDVTRPRDVRALVDDTVAAYGRLDCAFNN